MAKEFPAQAEVTAFTSTLIPLPAGNNRAEREPRPAASARKVSFGAQSGAGAKAREVLVSVVHTPAKRVPDPEARFRAVLGQLATDPRQEPVALLLGTS